MNHFLHWNRESFFFILYISMREELPLLRIPGKDRVYQQWKFSKNSNPNVFLSYMYRATTYMIEQAYREINIRMNNFLNGLFFKKKRKQTWLADSEFFLYFHLWITNPIFKYSWEILPKKWILTNTDYPFPFGYCNFINRSDVSDKGKHLTIGSI
ncbi:hypothetical protein ACJX0J_003276 (mitochondrion) [Zea mays]